MKITKGQILIDKKSCCLFLVVRKEKVNGAVLFLLSSGEYHCEVSLKKNYYFRKG